MQVDFLQHVLRKHGWEFGALASHGRQRRRHWHPSADPKYFTDRSPRLAASALGSPPAAAAAAAAAEPGADPGCSRCQLSAGPRPRTRSHLAASPAELYRSLAGDRRSYIGDNNKNHFWWNLSVLESAEWRAMRRVWGRPSSGTGWSASAPSAVPHSASTRNNMLRPPQDTSVSRRPRWRKLWRHVRNNSW